MLFSSKKTKPNQHKTRTNSFVKNEIHKLFVRVGLVTADLTLKIFKLSVFLFNKVSSWFLKVFVVPFAFIFRYNKKLSEAVKNETKGLKARLVRFASAIKTVRNFHFVEFYRVVVLSVSAVVVVGVLCSSGVWTRFIAAYNVKINGISLGYVKDTNVYNQAVGHIKEMVAKDEYECVIPQPEFKLCIVNDNRLDTPEKIAQEAVVSSDRLRFAYGLEIDGQLYVAAEDKSVIENSLTELLDKYRNGAANATETTDIRFTQNAVIVGAYFIDEDIADTATLKTKLAEENLPLTVSSVVRRTYSEDIPFGSVTVENPDKIKGYKKVTKAGIEGRRDVTVEIVYVNGVAVSETELSSVVVNEPVSQEITVGTAVVTTSTTSYKLSSADRVVWPVRKNSKMYVSAYFGDGRNHKGIDIASPCGTDIIAAASGTVVSAGWGAIGSGYGYSILVKGNDGRQYVYAHCSELYVSVGDSVVGGGVIASVGSTGDSTGNHLHFEIRIGGKPVNPAPFLGI